MREDVDAGVAERTHLLLRDDAREHPPHHVDLVAALCGRRDDRQDDGNGEKGASHLARVVLVLGSCFINLNPLSVINQIIDNGEINCIKLDSGSVEHVLCRTKYTVHVLYRVDVAQETERN